MSIKAIVFTNILQLIVLSPLAWNSTKNITFQHLPWSEIQLSKHFNFLSSNEGIKVEIEEVHEVIRWNDHDHEKYCGVIVVSMIIWWKEVYNADHAIKTREIKWAIMRSSSIAIFICKKCIKENIHFPYCCRCTLHPQ